MPKYKPLWALSPYELISLLDLMRFYADKFVGVIDSLRAISPFHDGIRLALYEVDRGPEFKRLNQLEELGNKLTQLAEICDDIGLESSSRQVKQMQLHASRGEYLETHFKNDLSQLIRRIHEDIDGRVCFMISRSDAEGFYENLAPLGQEVNDAFPSAVFDIQEAAKCRVFKRDTASVFHITRAVEVSLKILAKAVGAPTTVPSWDGILGKIDDELPKKYTQKTWSKGEEDFYSEAALHLRSYKNIRNNTQHADKKYTPEEAERIYGAVKLLMEHLATRLSEPSEVI